MKTPREMYNKLRRLETEIFQKNRKLRNLHTRHIINSQGNNRFVPERVNKNTYTNDQYMKNIQNAVRITFNELRPLIKEYNKRAKKYREIMGLPVMEKRGSWPEQLAFVRTKNSRNGPLPNVKNLYRKYAHIVTSGFGGGYDSRYVSLGLYHNKFYPNVQLLNALLAKNKAVETIREALYRPPKIIKRGMGLLPGGLGTKGGRLYARTIRSLKKQ